MLLTGTFAPVSADPPLHEALFYEQKEKGIIQCRLCPRNCPVPDGKRGFCGARVNNKGKLYSLSYGRLVSFNDRDPVEKKPLFHFLPGSKTFSVATAGCNLRCSFCQNWEISQCRPDETGFRYLRPQELLDMVKASGRSIIAYTYTEPTIFYEYMLETARLSKKSGVRNVMHSNGYINPEPLEQLCPFLDAANIDLKAFKDGFYAQLSEGTLEPVLQSLKTLRQAGVHLEITNLILSGYNDDPDSIRAMCRWIVDNLGADTPIHFSRAFPMYKLVALNPTPLETLFAARAIAQAEGLRYCYVGNAGANPGEHTYCPRCGRIVIRRAGYVVEEMNLKDGLCAFCGEKIAGVWQ